MVIVPLNDTTEARYAEIARKMLETGNWITPLHDYGVPFWAKPPLSSWLSAASMQLFGVSAWAARLPALGLSIAVIWLTFHCAKGLFDKRTAIAASVILASSLFFLLDAGTVMTDPSLIFCCTLISVAFCQVIILDNARYRYVFFIGCGLGLLAKGPIALVLSGLPIFMWTAFTNHWAKLWRLLPWFKGCLLTLAIALPWYILAELRTPGFLHYFFIGEHYLRFTQAGWNGDKYGFAHSQPLGIIWAFAIAGVFPWCIVSLQWGYSLYRQRVDFWQSRAVGLDYVLLWLILPLLFFSFAHNILYTYMFTTLPAFALFYAYLWRRSGAWQSGGALCLTASLTGILFIIASGIFLYQPQLLAKTQKKVVFAFMRLRPTSSSHLVYFAKRKPFSAQFYSQGAVLASDKPTTLHQLTSKASGNVLALTSHQATRLGTQWLNHYQPIAYLPLTTSSGAHLYLHR